MLLLSSPLWPFAILGLGIIFVITFIVLLRQHAFVALMLAAIFVGLLATDLPSAVSEHGLIKKVSVPLAVELPMVEFGITAGKIAFVIALAAVIGMALMESGAADRIVRSLIKVFGEKRAPFALMLSGFILSIPVFFDTVFFLLIPLAQALSLRLGKNYMLYVVSIAGGAGLTHSLVAPTPGPLIMAETLQLDLGISIIGGIAFCIIPAIAVLYIARWANKRMPVPIRENTGYTREQLETISNKSMDQLPGLFISLLPVLLPIVLISLASFMGLLRDNVPAWVQFFGNKNIAMLLGTIVALWIVAKQKGLGIKDMNELISGPLEVAGVIILITSAGGAFGAMIKHSGIGGAIEYATSGMEINYILLAWGIAAVMKIAQGSSTVAMITAASIVVALIGDGSGLPYHTLYIYLAIGFGSTVVSWMNDSGFWVIAKMSGFTEKETLNSWSLMYASLGIIGLIELLIMVNIFPGV